MKKKIIITAICFLLLISWGIRFAYLNHTAQRLVTEVYKQGEFVEYGDNFFYRSSSEQRNGYSVKVIEAKLIEMKDYLKKIGLPYDKYLQMIKDSSGHEKDYVIEIRMIIRNKGNTKGNFDRLDTRINGTNFRLSCEDILFDFMYPKISDSFSFKVRENTEYEICIPFAPESVDLKVCDANYVLNDDLYLILTQYPVKKMISLQIEE